jgi:hypothetical protein
VRTQGDIGPGVAVDIAFHAPGDHFPIAMVARSKIDQRRNLQGLLLHQTEHVSDSKKTQ